MTVPKHSPKRPGFIKLMAPFWVSEQRWKAWAQLVAVFAVIFGGIYLQVLGNRMLGEVTDALVSRKWDALKPALLLSVAVGVLSGVATHARSAIQGMLELHWRSWMTGRLLNQWTDSHVFYDIEREGLLSNADQRIAEDVKQFVHSTLNLWLNAIGITVSAVTFGMMLWELSGSLEFSIFGLNIVIHGYMVYLAFLYAFGSFALAHWVGKALIGLNMHRHTAEADFRHGAMQLRENAEQIAFYGGGKQESQRLMQRFDKIRGNVIDIIIRTVKVGLTTHTYGHIFAPLPTLAVLPRYLAGQITLGGITRVSGAFSALSTNLAFFTDSYGEFTDWIAVGHRLGDLSTSIQKAQDRVNGFDVERADQPEMSTGPLQLRKPCGAVLANVPPLRFAPGQRWLVRGPSGTGKSTLLRAVAGLWPHGTGNIALPAEAALMFLPQRSYIPSGSFKAAICYPGDESQFDDALCRRVLVQCGLAGHVHALHESDKWQQKLSGGEQQRLAFARVLLHRPDYVFLDEATSALDLKTERMMYQALIEQLPNSAVISIAHKASLTAFHDHFLDLAPASATRVPEVVRERVQQQHEREPELFAA